MSVQPKTITLTDEQKEQVLAEFKKTPDLMTITRTIFNDPSLDGRSGQGRAIREFLAQNQQQYNTSLFQRQEFVEFTQEQKEFMLSNNVEAGMKPLEIARLVFKDADIQSLTLKHRAVVEFLSKYRPEVVDDNNRIADQKWTPPKALSRAIVKVNDYTGSEWQELNMPTKVKKCCEKLLIYLRSPRFVHFVNSYAMQADRDLFESEFVRAVWDKMDLTNDELNVYVTVCVNYVRQKHIQMRLDRLNAILNDSADDQQDFTMRLTEIIKATSAELNECEKRIESMVNKLNGGRADRLKQQGEQTSNILALVQAFQDAEERKRMVMMAEMQNRLVEKEADRLEGMDEFKARILGISKRELL